MTKSAASQLMTARRSLADARLLLERGSHNAPLLLRQALAEALAVLVKTRGQPDREELLARVPSTHPAAALARRLAGTRQPDADALDHLIGLIEKPPAAGQEQAHDGPTAFEAAARPARIAPTRHRSAGKQRPVKEQDQIAPADRQEASSRDLAAGPTAFELAERSEAGASAERTVSSAAFWALMDRWSVEDEAALQLLGGGRSLTRQSKRPRFRLHGDEARIYATLRRIDTALEVMGESPSWLHRRSKGRTPLSQLLADPSGGGNALLRELNRAGLRAALRSAPRAEADAS